MTTKNSLFVMTLALAAASGHGLTAQVQTEVPRVVPGAKPVTVERINRTYNLLIKRDALSDPFFRIHDFS